MATTKTALLNDEAMSLFDVKSEKMIQTALYALGFRQECGRCGGTGRFSFNQLDGDRCYGCNGKKFVPMKPSSKVLDEAKIKVDAGELVRIRELGRIRIAARHSIAGLVVAARAVYMTIGDAYSVGSRVSRTNAENSAFVKSPIFFAQHMNNSIFWDHIRKIDRDVEFGNRKDFVRCVQEIEEATEMLVRLRDAWIEYSKAITDDAEREIYGDILANIDAHDRMIDTQCA